MHIAVHSKRVLKIPANHDWAILSRDFNNKGPANMNIAHRDASRIFYGVAEVDELNKIPGIRINFVEVSVGGERHAFLGIAQRHSIHPFQCWRILLKPMERRWR